ncbi:MAG: hypothetical protein KJO33_09640 [Gammaproteobacteria bacterium]|nr:hypothetical protein [Gammaproteobacteria bacterium]
MSMWSAIVLIVIAAMAGEAWRLHLKARSKGPHQQSLDELIRKVDALDRELRERVETLERIVTDEKAELKRQFDRLDKTG